MSIMVNNIVLGGQIDGEVNFHRVNDDIPVCNFVLRHKPNDNRNPEFDIPVAVWNSAAEAARDHLKDGSQVIVEGNMTVYKDELRLKATYVHFVSNCERGEGDDFSGGRNSRDQSHYETIKYDDGYRKPVRT